MLCVSEHKISAAKTAYFIPETKRRSNDVRCFFTPVRNLLYMFLFSCSSWQAGKNRLEALSNCAFFLPWRARKALTTVPNNSVKWLNPTFYWGRKTNNHLWVQRSSNLDLESSFQSCILYSLIVNWTNDVTDAHLVSNLLVTVMSRTGKWCQGPDLKTYSYSHLLSS